MLITCPNCGTNFSIPDAALGDDGRKLKCAKCGHKWFQVPLRLPEEDEDILDLDSPAFAVPPPRPAPPPPPPRLVADFPDFEPPSTPRFGARIGADRASDLDDDIARSLLDDGPQPVPEMFATHSTPRRGSTAPLWVVMIVLVLGGLGGGVYYFQDRLVELVPEAGDLLTQVGLRHEKPGAGLELRKAGTPERFVLNDVDVLVVRGIIANISDRIRPVPTMKLVLLDKAGQPVQEKLSRAPASALDPQGTASFKIMLERPDPNAVEVVVVFVDGPEAEAAGTPARPPVTEAPAAPAPALVTPPPVAPPPALPAPAASAPATPVPVPAVPAPAPVAPPR